MTKLYDLAVATSKYTTKDGKEKATWENIGSIMENDKGSKFMLLKATFNPAGIDRKQGSDCITVSMFSPKDKQQGSQSQSRSSATGQVQDKEDFNFSNLDDVPF